MTPRSSTSTNVCPGSAESMSAVGGDPPPHYAVALRDDVVGIAQEGSVDLMLARLLAPHLRRVGGDAHELDVRRFEVRVRLQVHDLFDARQSPGAHAEVQQHPLPSEIAQRDRAAFGGLKAEGRRRVTRLWERRPGSAVAPAAGGQAGQQDERGCPAHRSQTRARRGSKHAVRSACAARSG
jgi:hypothetical protein